MESPSAPGVPCLAYLEMLSFFHHHNIGQVLFLLPSFNNQVRWAWGRTAKILLQGKACSCSGRECCEQRATSSQPLTQCPVYPVLSVLMTAPGRALKVWWKRTNSTGPHMLQISPRGCLRLWCRPAALSA